MRQLTSHQINPTNNRLSVSVLDEPGSGNACQRYAIRWTDPTIQPRPDCYIHFQEGPILESGVNGVTHESLIAILIDRLEGFQFGPFACPENAEALEGLKIAQGALKRRTEARAERGVEGTHTV